MSWELSPRFSSEPGCAVSRFDKLKIVDVKLGRAGGDPDVNAHELLTDIGVHSLTVIAGGAILNRYAFDCESFRRDRSTPYRNESAGSKCAIDNEGCYCEGDDG